VDLIPAAKSDDAAYPVSPRELLDVDMLIVDMVIGRIGPKGNLRSGFQDIPNLREPFLEGLEFLVAHVVGLHVDPLLRHRIEGIHDIADIDDVVEVFAFNELRRDSFNAAKS
jgi:hypothetical protein